MTAEPKVNKETGEVLDTTFKSGDQEVHTSVEGLKRAADMFNPHSHRQLSLIDGIAVDTIRTEFAAALINEEDISQETDISRMHQRRFFVVSAKVRKISGKSKEDAAGNENLTKTVVFQPEDIAEIDMLSFERCIRDRDVS